MNTEKNIPIYLYVFMYFVTEMKAEAFGQTISTYSPAYWLKKDIPNHSNTLTTINKS